MKLWSGKIPVTIQPLFFLLVIALSWLNSFDITRAALWMIIITFSILAHEYGHALTARLFGQKVAIELNGMGGLTTRKSRRLKPWQEFLIVLNGPLVGVLLFFGCVEALHILPSKTNELWIYFFVGMGYVNLFWTVVNLLPVYPLDGGHLLRIILERLFGMRGIKFSFLISILVGAVSGVLFFSYALLLPGIFFFMFAFESYRNWQNIRSMTVQDQNIDIQRLMKRAERLIYTGHRQEAIELLFHIRQKTSSGLFFTLATEYVAKLLSDEGKIDDAYKLLLPEKERLSPEALHLLHKLACGVGEWRAAITVGNISYQNLPDSQTALLNATAHAVLNESEAAIGWLRTAIEKGLPNSVELFQKKEFDGIRSDPEFQKLLGGNLS